MLPTCWTVFTVCYVSSSFYREGFLWHKVPRRADGPKASPSIRSLPAAWSPSTSMKGLFYCLKFARTVLHQCSEWVFHSLMHDKKKNCFNNSTSSGFSHLVWDLGDWLCGIRGLMFVYLCWKSGSDWPTVKYQQPLHDCVLCSALSSGPLVCSSPTLNMSAACELMGKPCLWWLSAATGGNVVMLERPWCGPQHSVSTLTQTEVRGFEMFMLDIPLCSRRSVS